MGNVLITAPNVCVDLIFRSTCLSVKAQCCLISDSKRRIQTTVQPCRFPVVLLIIQVWETGHNDGSPSIQVLNPRPAGFILGTGQTLLETKDGGKTWESREVPQAQDEGINYRFLSISFSGKEGWIVGKPAILLHTKDGGVNWERTPLSSKLPGAPLLITALPGEPGQAEMVTDQARPVHNPLLLLHFAVAVATLMHPFD